MFKHYAIAVAALVGTAVMIGCGGSKDDGLPDTGTVGTRILGSWAVSSVTYNGNTAACPGGSIEGYQCPTGDVTLRTDGTAKFDGKTITYNFFDNVLRLDLTPPQAFDVQFVNKATEMVITSKSTAGAKLELVKVSN